MGSGKWDPSSWATYSTTNVTNKGSVDDLYAARSMAKSFDPQTITKRESRDSSENPESTPIIVGLDVTGSMSSVLDSLAREGLPKLMHEIYDRKPVKDPQVCCLGIGDAEAGDIAPLQATQFESDIRIAEQLQKLYLERGGGGNSYESYALAWYFAALKTVTDSFEKRGKKGYLFTIGDEEPTPYLLKKDLIRVFGDAGSLETDMMSIDEILTLASRQWELFHIIVDEGSHARALPDKTHTAWAKVLGQRVIHLADKTKLAEVVVSAIQVAEGESADKVAASWDGTTSVVVRTAVAGLPAFAGRAATSGEVRL